METIQVVACKCSECDAVRQVKPTPKGSPRTAGIAGLIEGDWDRLINRQLAGIACAGIAGLIEYTLAISGPQGKERQIRLPVWTSRRTLVKCRRYATLRREPSESLKEHQRDEIPDGGKSTPDLT